MKEYVLLALFTVHVYLALELVLAAAARPLTTAVDLDLELQFHRPYLAASLRDFWGHQWNPNISVLALLRQSVFQPVRTCLGAPAGMFTAFAVSSLMHEVVFSYHHTAAAHGGGGRVHRTARRLRAGGRVVEGWPRPLGALGRAAGHALTLAFVGGTGFRLFFPAKTRTGPGRQAGDHGV